MLSFKVPARTFYTFMRTVTAVFQVEIMHHEIPPRRGFTLNELQELVLNKLRDSPDPGGRVFRVVFFRLRRFIAELLEIPPATLRPDSELEDFFPRENRRALWRRVRAELYANIPPLEPPTFVSYIVLALQALSVVTILIDQSHFFAGITVFLLAGALKRFLEINFTLRDMKELTEDVIEKNYREELPAWEQTEARALLEELFVEFFAEPPGVRPSGDTRIMMSDV